MRRLVWGPVRLSKRVNDYGAELHVKTVKYFKSIERVQDEVEATRAKQSETEGK
jgi:hypothetical protein